VAAQLAASREGLGSMELVMYDSEEVRGVIRRSGRRRRSK
jgi:hypothetical protein